MSLAAFWAAVVFLVQTLVVFPATVLLRGRLRPRPHSRGPVKPSVSVVIAAHDEAACIATKLESVFAADYPPERLEVVVASDGSADGTAHVAGQIDGRVRVLDLERVGKATALNRAVAAARGEIIVFTDANSIFDARCLRRIVAPFADPEVGGVAGNQCYLETSSNDDGTAGAERSYWDLDRALKVAESAGGHVIGATGALYAVRRDLYQPVPDGVTDDFTISTGVIEQGHRLVFAPDAVVFEPVAGTTDAEFRRKVRVMTRGLQAVVHRRRLLDPSRHGFYAYQLINHKVLRRLLAAPLVLLLAGSIGCRRRHILYRLAMVAQLGVYGSGAVGLLWPRSRVGRSRPCGMSAYFCMVNAAGAVAASNIVRGRRIDRWATDRSTAEQSPLERRTTERLTTDHPSTESPNIERPMAERPVAAHPAHGQPVPEPLLVGGDR